MVLGFRPSVCGFFSPVACCFSTLKVSFSHIVVAGEFLRNKWLSKQNQLNVVVGGFGVCSSRSNLTCSSIVECSSSKVLNGEEAHAKPSAPVKGGYQWRLHKEFQKKKADRERKRKAAKKRRSV